MNDAKLLDEEKKRSKETKRKTAQALASFQLEQKKVLAKLNA